MDGNTIFTTLTATGFASAAFVFLAKILSNHLLSVDLERFKADLKSANEKELERLRADLRIAAFQQETTFAKLHEKRAEVIAELYRRLIAVERAMIDLLSPIQLGPGPSIEKKEDTAAQAANAFIHHYREHQIYFDETLCMHLANLDTKLWSAWVDYQYMSKDTVNALGRRKALSDAWKTISEEVPPIRQEIEQTFRQLLGLTAQEVERRGIVPMGK